MNKPLEEQTEQNVVGDRDSDSELNEQSSDRKEKAGSRSTNLPEVEMQALDQN